MEYLGKYLNLCYRYLSIRNRSVKEIQDYLTKKKADPEVIEQVVAKLKAQKFLDDEAFARSWVLYRARFRPRGKQLLKIELRQKGITKEIIEQVLSEEREDIPDQLTQATEMIEKRMVKMQGKPRQEIYNKVGSFLGRRGFSWEVIKKAIDHYLNRD